MIKTRTCIQAHKNGTHLTISFFTSDPALSSYRCERTHVDILNPAALYTAAKTNPTTPEQTRATAAPNADHTNGIQNTGHSGNGFLGLLIFSLAVFGVGGGRRSIVRDNRDVEKHAREHRNRIVPNRIRFQ
jgi:hypothetical protein